MPYTIVEIISRREHVVFHSGQCLRFHISRCQLTGGPALPVGIRFLQFPLGLLRYVKWICRPGLYRVKLCFQPFVRELRVGLTAPWSDGRASHDQLQVTDDDRNILQNVLKCLRAADDHGFIFRLAV